VMQVELVVVVVVVLLQFEHTNLESNAQLPNTYENLAAHDTISIST
jgi:hypothetical protein